MGFIRAFVGAIGGTFADQWKDYYTIPANVSATAALVPAVPQSQNAGRGENYKGSQGIITNGSVIVVPEGFGLITMENGAFTGFIADAGGYQFTSTDVNAQSFFSGGGLIETVVKQSWERFKFGGQPGSQQLAFFVNLKEIPDNKFGTKNEIYFDDAYLQAQVGVIARGVYTIKIVDPLLFVKQFVPVGFGSSGEQAFDFADNDNPAAEQLFNEVVGSLQQAFSIYTNDPDKDNRITRIQADTVGFANSLAQAVETNYHWRDDRGLEIFKAALIAADYDEDTKALLSDVRKADALSGARGNSFLQQSVARGVQAAGENPSGGGAMGMAFMGMGVNAAGGMAQGLQQPVDGAAATGAVPTGSAPNTASSSAQGEDPYEKLTKLKGLLDAGVITQEDFDAAKNKLLGL